MRQYLGPCMGPAWTLHGPRPAPCMGLSLGPAWARAQAQAGWGPLVQGHLTLYEKNKSQGFFFLGQGPGQNPWPWSLQEA